MTMTAEPYGWSPTKFGTAQVHSGGTVEKGRFYSHRYDAQGAQDVKDAARDYILHTVEDETTQKIALKLLEQEGVETDLYMRQTQERWVIYCQDIIDRAADIRSVV